MPARPSGKVRHKERQIFEKRRGNVFGSEQQERIGLSDLRFVFEGSCHSVANRSLYRGADKSLARPGRKQARKHVRDARDFNNIETQAVIKFPPPLQDKAPKEIHAILTETLVCFLPDRAKDLSAPL